MQKISFKYSYWPMLVAAGMLTINTASAADSSLAACDKRGKIEKQHRRHNEVEHRRAKSRHLRSRPDIRIGTYFDKRHRAAVRNYYGREFRSGHCPPGLVKTRSGCLPPGRTKPWVLGRPLPRSVVYAPLAPRIAMEIGVPPVGYKFVRVASDILLISVATGMVVDAITDFGGM